MVRVAVLRFPGTWSERDFEHALSLVGAETEILWHTDVDLSGFQILCEAGLLPGALIRNAGLEYISDWVRVRCEGESTPFTHGLRDAVLRMPIGHGEGCFVADPATLERIEEDGLVLFRYVDERGIATPEANPNGSVNNIAGLRNAAGNVVGLMPHPERCAEPILGGTDGLRMLESLVAGGVGTLPALVR